MAKDSQVAPSPEGATLLLSKQQKRFNKLVQRIQQSREDIALYQELDRELSLVGNLRIAPAPCLK